MNSFLNKSLNKLEDIKKSVGATNFINYSTTLSDDTFTYNPTTNIISAKVSTSNLKGHFIIQFRDVKIGDVIEINVETLNISGSKVKLSIDASTSMDLSVGGANKIYTVTSDNDWKSSSLKYIVQENSTFLRCGVGLWTGDTGEFKVRNFTATHNAVGGIKYATPQMKRFVVRKNSGNWEIRNDFSNDMAIITKFDTEQLNINYETPFVGLRPVAVASGEFLSPSIRPACSYSDLTYVRLAFIDDTTGQRKALDGLADGTYANLIIIGD